MKIASVYNIIFNKITISILFSISLFLSFFFFFCSTETSSSFLSAAASFMAAALTLQVAISADKTSKEALKMSEQLLNIEIIKEGPVIYITDQEIIPSSSQRTITLKNYGESPAVNIKCELFEHNRYDPLFVYSVEPGKPSFYFDILINTDKLPTGNQSLNYIITYENFFGKKFKNTFTITENNAHEGNQALTQRVSVYKIKNQKISLDES